MPRPSRNVDQLLVASGQVLLSQSGVRGLRIRQVAAHAGVNLGMFHYHFKTKETFIRALLDDRYNQMFAELEFKSKSNQSALENLRASITHLARFGRDNRLLIVHLMGDALAGEVVAVEFLHANMPRHFQVITGLLRRAQQEGALRKLPVMQALVFLMGAIGAPIFAGTAAIHNKLMATTIAQQFEQHIFTDAAIAERLDMALAGLAAPSSSGGQK